MAHISWSCEETAPISCTWGFLVWPSFLKRSDRTSLRVLITALLSASSFVSFIYFLYCTQREHSVPAPGTHCSFPLDDLHMCSWKIILKTSGGGEWKEKKSLECLAKLLGISSDISLCSLCPPLTQISQRLRHQAWGLLVLLPWAQERSKMGCRGEREGSTVHPSSNRQPSDGQHPLLSSQLWIAFKGNALSQPSLCNWVFFQAIPFFSFFFFNFFRKLRSSLWAHIFAASLTLARTFCMDHILQRGKAAMQTHEEGPVELPRQTTSPRLAKKVAAFPVINVRNKVSSY